MGLRFPTRLPDWIAIVVSGAALAGSMITNYSGSTKTLEHRLTAVEQSQQDQQRTIDHIDGQVNDLVRWALGK